jgi:hypothetical protein
MRGRAGRANCSSRTTAPAPPTLGLGFAHASQHRGCAADDDSPGESQTGADLFIDWLDQEAEREQDLPTAERASARPRALAR